MKKIYTFLLGAAFCCTSLIATAQTTEVPNGGFEDWAALAPGFPEMPKSWISSDLINVFFYGATTKTVIQTTDKKSGKSALFMKRDTATLSINFGGTPVSFLDTLSSFAVLGDLISQKQGVFTSDRPVAIAGFYKYKNPDKDTSRIAAVAGAYDSTKDSLIQVGVGELLFKPSATYKSFTVPIQYVPGSTGMDSLNIVIQCGSDIKKSNKTELTIDDLGILYVVGTNEYEDVPINIYPNPAFEFAYFDLKAVPSATMVQLYDITGRLVATETVNDTLLKLPLSDLSSGNYFYHVLDNNKKTIKTGVIAVK